MILTKHRIVFAATICGFAIFCGQQFYVNAKQASLDRHLIEAVKRDDLTSVASLLDSGASSNATDYVRTSSTFGEALMGFVRRIRHGEQLAHAEPSVLLVSLNAWWPEGDAQEHPPANSVIVELLVERGADVNYECIGGDVPIIEASVSGRPQIVQLLVDKGAYVNVRDSYGYSALDYADGRHQHAYVPAIISILKRAGARD